MYSKYETLSLYSFEIIINSRGNYGLYRKNYISSLQEVLRKHKILEISSWKKKHLVGISHTLL